MVTGLNNARLRRISQSPKDTIALWKEGASLVADSGHQIDALLLVVASDRWKLSKQFNNQGKRLMLLQTPACRSAISRFYYSMYHAARACVFLETKGDDHERHSELPLHLPSALKTPTNWQTILKNARLLRNRADYESYPKTENSWKSEALAIQTNAANLLVDSKVFLISKGCTL